MLADVNYDLVTILGPVIGVGAGALLTALAARWRKRRRGDTDMKTMVRKHDETLYGRDPTREDPDGELGLVKEVGEVKSMLATIIAKVTPNGGNTRESGDLLLLIAKKLDIDIPERGHDGA